MDDRTKNELWKKEMEKRNKGNKIQVRYIESHGSAPFLISLALAAIGVVTGIVGFFYEKDW